MNMTPRSPFEGDEVTRFRAQLHAVGRKIDEITTTHGLDETETTKFKMIASRLAKCDVMQRAAGDDILDKIASGIKPTLLERLTGHSHRYDVVNTENRGLALYLFGERPGFDGEAFVNGNPQDQQFKERNARDIEILEAITSEIREPYSHLAGTEEAFFDKVRVFREFEAREINEIDPWAKVEDPFSAEAPAVDLSAEAAPAPGH